MVETDFESYFSQTGRIHGFNAYIQWHIVTDYLNPIRRGKVFLEDRSSNRWISVMPTSTEVPMNTTFRFGRRIPLPSTAEDLHELKVLSAQEEGRKRYALADGLPETASWDEIGAHRARAEREVASAAAARLLE